MFTDLGFADDDSLLAEILEVPVLPLRVMQEEASTFGLQINWSKTKILQVPISTSGGSRGEVLLRIGIARSCMNMLERRIWKSSIRLETKIRLYQTYIVPVLMYGCETWATTKYLLYYYYYYYYKCHGLECCHHTVAGALSP